MIIKLSESFTSKALPVRNPLQNQRLNQYTNFSTKALFLT